MSRIATHLFQSLHERDFRRLWLGMLPSTLAMQMGFVTNSYLAYELTGSAAAVGLVTIGFGIPMLFLSLVGGVVADRISKRRVLIVTQSIVCLSAVLLAALVLAGWIRIWHMTVAALMMGTAFALAMPARQAFIAELVGRERLTNAIAINNAGLNMARIVGPAMAGALIGFPAVGIGGVYVIMTVMYTFVIWTLTRLPDRGAVRPPEGQSGARALIAGLVYIRGNSVLVALMVLTFAPIMFGMSYQALMPVFAEAVFNVGPEGLGILMTANGVGAFLGSLAVGAVGNTRRGLLLLGLGTLFGGALAGFAFSYSYVLALVLLPVVGGASAAYLSLNMSLLMDYTDAEYHGRVMSVTMLTFSIVPLSVLPAGALVDIYGAPLVIGTCGLLLLAVVALYGLLHPSCRRVA